MRGLLGIVLLALSGAVGCRESTPAEPETRPVLVLGYTGPCTQASVLVTIDGTPVGRVRLPGATSFLVEPGPHEVQVGFTPAFTIQMPADRDLGLTNVPSPCP